MRVENARFERTGADFYGSMHMPQDHHAIGTRFLPRQVLNRLLKFV